jgi:DNA-binding Lrp family transcriptional regulator
MYLNIDTTGIMFPAVFASTPRTVLATIEVTGDTMYMVNVRGRTVSGYTAILSDTVQESGVVIHTFASL